MSPDAVSFLLRTYLAGDNDAAREAVEAGLTHALDMIETESEPCRRLAWLHLLAGAAAAVDDSRPGDAVSRVLPAAIDALEALVRRSYEPGDGLLGASCEAQFACAIALLDGFDLTGRLPYAMLAEELLQTARRRWWRVADGRFDADFATNCAAARLLCRLAALHADSSYVAAAVVAPDRAYAHEAGRILTFVSTLAPDHPQQADVFGCALGTWFALESNLP